MGEGLNMDLVAKSFGNTTYFPLEVDVVPSSVLRGGKEVIHKF